MKAIFSRNAMIFLASTGFLVAHPSPPAAAQGVGETSLEERANEAYSSASWQEATEYYRELSREKPGDPAVWYRLARSLENSGSAGAEPAVTAYERALKLGFRPGPALVGIARVHARESNPGGALDALERLSELGPSRGAVRQIENSGAFDEMRSHPEFVAALRELTPCTAEAYRQFDFWLGDWEVRSPQDQVVGKNTVTSSLDGCMLIENWESVAGGKGMSINYFDHRDQTWTQIYRDNTGNVGNWPPLTGSFRDGAMRLETPEDAQPRSRWIWTKISEDKVRQMAESSSDGGETWTVSWDSYYIRVGD